MVLVDNKKCQNQRRSWHFTG